MQDTERWKQSQKHLNFCDFSAYLLFAFALPCAWVGTSFPAPYSALGPLFRVHRSLPSLAQLSRELRGQEGLRCGHFQPLLPLHISCRKYLDQQGWISAMSLRQSLWQWCNAQGCRRWLLPGRDQGRGKARVSGGSRWEKQPHFSCTVLMHFVLDSPRWPQLSRTYVPSLTYLPAVCYPTHTYLPTMYFPALQTASDFSGMRQPSSESPELMCVACTWWQVTLHRANPLHASGKGSHAPGGPTQQTLQCPTGHAGRAGRMERANFPMKAWADWRLSLSAPKSHVSPSRGTLGPLVSLSAVSQACAEKLEVSPKFSSFIVFVWTSRH